MGRIFTFGCSFTEYSWPTWADLLLYKNQGINYGICGGGFEQVINNLVQCDVDFQLNEQDQVIIVYPNLLRWDMPFYPKMLCVGNALTSPWKDHLDTLYNLEGLTYKNLNMMVMIDNFLKQKKVKYHYGSMFPIFENPENYFLDVNLGNDIKPHLKYVEKNIMKDQLVDFYTFIYGKQNETHPRWDCTKEWSNRGCDYHPTIISHYRWLTTVLLPKLENVDLKLSLDDINKMEYHLMNNLPTERECDDYFLDEGLFNNRNFIYQNKQARLKRLI